MEQTYLTLTPEFGGTKFGPFSGTINLGTDGGRCQITLAPGTAGVQPLHAMITDTGNGWQVQPTQMGAQVFLRKPNGRVVPVTMAVQAGAGDTVVLGNQAGPALVLSRATPPRVGTSSGGGMSRRNKLSGDAFAREARRQVESSLITTPYGREIYRFWTRFRSGSFMRPRYIIGAVGGLLFLVGTGCVGCVGAIGTYLGLQ